MFSRHLCGVIALNPPPFSLERRGLRLDNRLEK